MSERAAEPYDEVRVNEASRRFAAALFARLPQLRARAEMEPTEDGDGRCFFLRLSAPSGDAEADLVVWMNQGDEPSVAFGAWHTHGGLAPDGEDGLVALVAAILEDRLLVCQSEPPGPTWSTVVDSTANDLVEILTGPDAPTRVRLRSWSGVLDCVVGLDTLDDDGRPKAWLHPPRM